MKHKQLINTYTYLHIKEIIMGILNTLKSGFTSSKQDEIKAKEKQLLILQKKKQKLQPNVPTPLALFKDLPTPRSIYADMTGDFNNSKMSIAVTEVDKLPSRLHQSLVPSVAANYEVGAVEAKAFATYFNNLADKLTELSESLESNAEKQKEFKWVEEQTKVLQSQINKDIFELDNLAGTALEKAELDFVLEKLTAQAETIEQLTSKMKKTQ